MAPFPAVFTELALGGSYSDQGRLDVVSYIAARGYTIHLLRGYEVKATRSDFLADIRAGKWRQYLPYVHRLYFAFPEGVAQPGEVPIECGVLVRSERSSYMNPTGPKFPYWRIARPAKRLSAEAFGIQTLSRLVLNLKRTGRA